MIAYKALIELEDGTLWSVIMRDKPNVGVRYEEGIESVAPAWLARLGYHLLVFETLDAAKEFATSNVWEVEARDMVPVKSYDHPLSSKGFGGSDAWWPFGTRMCKGVTLLRKVF